ncbi:DHH family phosphoesterase [Paenibacillus polymyxa]|uniref:DHH family phosphoesterase n=1 Tax=Paenibacillus polymyxa TaxID=1406 RepID=UPI00287FD12C|nr:DHH family phosphoesterase [Paenibacillus polymyxa]
MKQSQSLEILISWDYDGVTSLVLLYKYLKNFTDEVHYVCNERSEGHSINNLISAVSEQTRLFIAVDSSSNDLESMKELTDRGIDCLVIDHHAVTKNNPYITLVNPQQEGCMYPNKNACGGLLVFKVCKVIDDYMDTHYTNQLSDLPGFSLMADMMSMMEMENRYYAKLSLKGLRHAGLKALFTAMNFDLNNLSATDFLYGVSPAVTAATRADNIQLAIDFLMCDEDNPEIKVLIKDLIRLNERRKTVQAEALIRLKPLVNENDKVVIVFDPTLGKGMNGLVAQELSRTYNRPAIVLGNGDNEVTYAGSFRGLEDFSMLDMLGDCKNVIYTGGHDGAGGLQLLKKDIEVLRQELNEKLRDFVADNSLYYDLEFDINEVNENLINYLSEFYRITGNKFKQGYFLIKGLFTSDKKLMGKSNNTVKIDCDRLQLMKFKTDEKFYKNVPVFSEIEAIGTLNINVWKVYRPKFKVTKTLQLFIEDYKEVNQTK